MNTPRLLYIGLFLITLGCNQKAGIENIAIAWNANTSVATISADFTQPGSAVLSIWPKNSNDTVLIESITPPATKAVFKLNLRPATEYCYSVTYSSELTSIDSRVECISAPPVPAALPEFTVTMKQDYEFTGGILLKKYGSPAAHYIINSEGRIIWYHLADSMPEKSFNLVNNNELLTLPTNKEILRLNFSGDTLADYLTGTHMDQEVHHDALLHNNNTVAITYEYKHYDFSPYGGLTADSVQGDGIVVLNKNGQKVWHWSIFNDNAPLVSQKLYKEKNDYGHANAIAVDDQGNYLLSFRDFNQIWKIEAETGKVLWKLGDAGDFPLQADQYFQKQHAIHFDWSNNLVVFDNIAGNRTMSRILFFDLDEQNRTVSKFREIKLPTDLYSFKQASAYQFSDTTYLVCSSMNNRLAIIDLEGNPVWQAQSSETFYRAYFVNDLDL